MKLVFPNDEYAETLLNPGINRIGSAPDNMLVLGAPCMPPVVAEIHILGPYIRLVPRSDAEIMVNDHQVREAIGLRHGDRVRIGGIHANVVAFTDRPSANSDDGRLENRHDAPKLVAAPARYVLRGLTGPLSGQLYSLSRPVVIGRDPDCEIVLARPDISRRHAALRSTAHGVVVEDLGSSNGVYVNYIKVDRGILLAGDELRLATYRFIVCALAADAPTPASGELARRHVPPPPPPARKRRLGRKAVLVAAAVAVSVLVIAMNFV